MRLPKRLLLSLGLLALAARRSLKAPYDLRGKSVLITGGSRGLGYALAERCLAQGARLTLMARTGGQLERARSLLSAHGEVQTVIGDVTVQADQERAVAAAVQAYGRLDVLINNAGIIQTGPLADMTEADFRSILEVNALAPLRLTRTALPQLRQHRGRVLIVSSVAAKVAVPHLAPYSVSKAASAALGQALHTELAREGVSVTTALPGLLRTGSARQAQVKGQQAQEYALFATLDSLPVLSLDAHEAARRMLTALLRGDAEVMIGGPALLLRLAQTAAPQLTADLLVLSNRLLPAPTGRPGAVRGAEAETALTRGNAGKRAAELRLNQQDAG